MSDIVWPSYFPTPSQEYNIDPQTGSIRSTMDSGYIRQRQRFTTDLKTIGVVWMMEDITYRYFDAWFKAYLGMGSGWFTMDVAVGGGMTSQRCRFDGSYSARLVGFEMWEVSAKLELIDPVGLNPDMLSLLLNVDFLVEFDNGLEEVVMSDYQQWINVDLPDHLDGYTP